MAAAPAVRVLPSSSAISPESSPGSSTFSMISSPSGEVEAVARVAFAEDLPVWLEPGDRRVFHPVIERALRHRRNQKVLRKKPAPLRRRITGHYRSDRILQIF